MLSGMTASKVDQLNVFGVQNHDNDDSLMFEDVFSERGSRDSSQVAKVQNVIDSNICQLPEIICNDSSVNFSLHNCSIANQRQFSQNQLNQLSSLEHFQQMCNQALNSQYIKTQELDFDMSCQGTARVTAHHVRDISFGNEDSMSNLLYTQSVAAAIVNGDQDQVTSLEVENKEEDASNFSVYQYKDLSKRFSKSGGNNSPQPYLEEEEFEKAFSMLEQKIREKITENQQDEMTVIEKDVTYDDEDLELESQIETDRLSINLQSKSMISHSSSGKQNQSSKSRSRRRREVFERLFQDHKKIDNDRKMKQQIISLVELADCTFKPEICRERSNLAKRTQKQFLDDQNKFLEKKQRKIEAQIKIKQEKEEEFLQRQSFISTHDQEQLIERLYLKKPQMQKNDQSFSASKHRASKSPNSKSPIRSIQQLTQRLYDDAVKRQHQKSQSPKKDSNTNKVNEQYSMIQAKRILNCIKQSFQDLGYEDLSLIDFAHFNQLMIKLGYSNDQNKDYHSLIKEVFKHIASYSYDQYSISKKSFFIFILALNNVYIPWMSKQSQDTKDFFIKTQQDTQKLHMKYFTLWEYKQKQKLLNSQTVTPKKNMRNNSNASIDEPWNLNMRKKLEQINQKYKDQTKSFSQINSTTPKKVEPQNQTFQITKSIQQCDQRSRTPCNQTKANQESEPQRRPTYESRQSELTCYSSRNQTQQRGSHYPSNTSINVKQLPNPFRQQDSNRPQKSPISTLDIKPRKLFEPKNKILPQKSMNQTSKENISSKQKVTLMSTQPIQPFIKGLQKRDQSKERKTPEIKSLSSQRYKRKQAKQDAQNERKACEILNSNQQNQQVQKKALLYLDVNLAVNNTQRLVIYNDEIPEDKAKSFARLYDLNPKKEEKLISAIQEQMKNLKL